MHTRRRAMNQLLRIFRTIISCAILSLVAAGAASGQVCVGDCNEDGRVSIDELVRGVNVALGLAGSEVCPLLDTNLSGTVSIDELIDAVNNALGGCPTVATPTEEPTATPTANPTVEVIEVVAGSTIVALNALNGIPSVFSAIVTGVAGPGGAASLAGDGSGSGSVEACPMGGFVETMGGFPNWTFNLNACEVPRSGGSVFFDGTINVNITNVFALSGTATMNATIVFKDAVETAELTTTANLSASLRLRVRGAQGGEPCDFEVPLLGDVVLSGVAFTFNGTLESEAADGTIVGVTFQSTTADLEIQAYGAECVPVEYRLELDGPATVSQTPGGGGGAGVVPPFSFDLTFVDFVIEASGGGQATFGVSGQITADCFDGTVTLSTVQDLSLILGQFCPEAGQINVQDLGDIFYSNGAVTVGGESYPSCLAAELLMCVG